MATIQKRLNSKGEASFHVRVRLRGHPVQTCTFQRLTDAREWGKRYAHLSEAHTTKVVTRMNEQIFG